MSNRTEALPDDRIREEIGKLMAQTVKLAAEQAKLNAEAGRMSCERWWVPAVAISAAAGAGAAVVGVLMKLFG